MPAFECLFHMGYANVKPKKMQFTEHINQFHHLH